MIYESFVWKKELKKELTKFRKLVEMSDGLGEVGISDNINLKVEKFFFVSAFIIRKLNEAKKLSDELNDITAPVVEYKRIHTDYGINFRNNHLIENFYDLEQGSDTSIGVAALCNMLIHSFVFKVVVSNKEECGRETVIGILVNSDRSKDKAVYYLQVEDFSKLLEEIINDDILSSSYNYVSGKVINSRKPLFDNIEDIFGNM